MADRRSRRIKDKPPIFVRHVVDGRLGHVLVPVMRYDHDRVAKLTFGVDLRVDFRQERSPKHHRFYWALLGKVIEGTDKFGRNTEMLHRYLKLECGLVEVVQFFDGTSVMDLTSTAWMNMDQVEFREYFDRAVQIILERILPGVKRRHLIEEAEKMLGVREREIWKEAA